MINNTVIDSFTLEGETWQLIRTETINGDSNYPYMHTLVTLNWTLVNTDKE